MAKTPKEVVDSAWKYLKEIPGIGNISNARVEELEQIPDGTSWKVVISYEVTGDFVFEKSRSYKEFSVDDSTGEVVSMKIKNV